MIEASKLTKQFRNYTKEPGLKGALRSFFVRDYKSVSAVDAFSVSIKEGEFVGLLGPNGAGKTTFMKMCSGLIAPSSGDLRVLGCEPFSRPHEFRRNIALVMGQKSQLWWDIPAMDSFNLLRSYYEVPRAIFRERLEELTALLRVSELLQIHVRKLSLGERMKMELIAALLHHPKVLFLDEPTIGLDIVAQRNIREFLRSFQALHKTTIVLTSHYMADVAALCDRLVLILAGKKRYDGSIDSFERILGSEKFVTLRFSVPVEPNDELWAALNPVWHDEHTRVDLRIDEDSFRRIMTMIFERYPVVDFHSEQLPIERVMATLLEKPELIDEGSANAS